MVPKDFSTASSMDDNENIKPKIPEIEPRKLEPVYINFLTFGYWHIAGLYGLYLGVTAAKWETILLCFILYMVGELGVTAGAHRLWTHKAYKATLPLQIILMIFNSISFMNTASDWVRDHRMHHKYSDTDADPHNARRGFFYSHIGWLLVKKHPLVKKYGRTIDMSDIDSNPVLNFQKRYRLLIISNACFILPSVLPVLFWNESFNIAWHINVLRYMLHLNFTFLVNSAAHMWGSKPYDKAIPPTQNIMVSILTNGEGFHNYHHVFPWDYRAAELGNNKYNLTTKFIDFFAWIGWAYDLKTVPESVIKSRSVRTGDNTDLWGNKQHDENKNGLISHSQWG